MDYYLQDKSRLEGQPKRAIAEYAEQNGILVPRRFDSLAEARDSHKPILLRSEHPQEYDGISGLLDSLSLSNSPVRDSQDTEEVKQKYFEKEEKADGIPLYKQFCKSLGLNEEEFRKQTSFSIWECLEGLNRAVIADSSIPNRYHIMTLPHRDDIDNWFCNYAIVDNGELTKDLIMPLPEELKEGLRDLIETYEQIRHLERFDSNNCPIMEFQTYKGKNYFLQYHRTRDFLPVDFILDRDLKEGEIEVPFVRGATSKEGGTFKTTVYYAGNWYFNPEDEDGSFDLHHNRIFPELQFKKRKLQIINSKDLTNELTCLVADHIQKSKLFKPKVSAIFPIELVMKDNEVLWGGYDHVHFANGRKYVPRDPTLKDGESIFNFSEEVQKGHNASMDIHFVSDGKRAFVKRV
jgi:hypothetical protein